MNYRLMSLYQVDMTIEGNVMFLGIKNTAIWGKIVLISVAEQEMLIQAEIYKGQDEQDSTIAKKKREIFEKVVGTVNACFHENFPRPIS